MGNAQIYTFFLAWGSPYCKPSSPPSRSPFFVWGELFWGQGEFLRGGKTFLRFKVTVVGLGHHFFNITFEYDHDHHPPHDVDYHPHHGTV